MYTIDTTCFDECFLFHVITERHCFSYKFIVTHWFGSTAMLLRSSKQVFWKKCAFYIRYLLNNITMPLIPKKGPKSFYFLNALNRVHYWYRVFTLTVCECSTFFFKLKGFLEASSAQIWFYKLFLISESKNQNTWHLPNKHWLCKCYKVWEDYIEFDTEQAENTSSAERQKTNFPKESVENADDLYEPVLNKIMTTHY